MHISDRWFEISVERGVKVVSSYISRTSYECPIRCLRPVRDAGEGDACCICLRKESSRLLVRDDESLLHCKRISHHDMGMAWVAASRTRLDAP